MNLVHLLPGLLGAYVVGVALAGAIWIVGFALVDVVDSSELELRAPSLVFAYPLGLVFVVLAAALLLLSPWLAIVDVIGAAFVAYRISRRLAAVASVVRAIRPSLVTSLPSALALVLVTGSVWRGPTRTLSAPRPGDIAFYVSRAASAADSILPFRDLLVLGRHFTYVESGAAIVAAAAARLTHVDLFFFHSVSLIASCVVSLAIGLGLLGLARTNETGRRGGVGLLASLGLFAAGATYTASWLVESVGESLAIPIAFTILVLAWYEQKPRLFIVGVTASVVALGLTKSMALPALFGVVAWTIWSRRYWRRSLGSVVYLLATATAIVVSGVVEILRTVPFYLRHLAVTFTPWHAVRGVATNPWWLTVSELALDLSEVTLLVLLARRREWALFAVLGVATIYAWTNGTPEIAPQGGLVEAFVACACAFALRPPWGAVDKTLLTVAAGLGLTNAWYRDYIQNRTSLIVLFIVAGVFVALATAASSRTWDPRASLRLLPPLALGLLSAFTGHVYLALLASAAAFAVTGPKQLLAFVPPRLVTATRVVTLTATALAAVLLAARAERQRNFAVQAFAPVLTVDDYAAWRAVSQNVPRDALVFAPLDPYDLAAYYPAVARRQIYLGGARYGLALVDPNELTRRRQANRDVLRGRLAPSAVTLGYRFRSFFAVLPARSDAPATFTSIYKNSTWTLYRITS